MNWARISYQQLKLTRAKNIFLLALLTLISSSSYAKAEKVKPAPPVVHFVPPPPPSTQVIISGRQRGGASRGDCPAVDKPLTALVPASKQALKGKPKSNPALNHWQAVWGLTVASHPTLWFYVPYPLTAKQPIEFVLQDAEGNNIYKTSLLLVQKQPSLVEIKIPSTTIPLAIGKMYQWYFLVGCNADAPPFVKGWVQRVAINSNFKRQLQAASPQQRAALLATKGIWYDALSTLAQLRLEDPNDGIFISNWVNLLSSGGLKVLSGEPMPSTSNQTNTNRLQPISQ